ncbi:MAG: TraR/DksA family transcriptional regulator [Candidatus Scalindua sp.]|nr:TraR/DksA family transcriptional regulator [Candidatus Scalindua sp.]MBT6049003.1 TraR/DksA family transcriptional regulator [Candidatus Scalindua sp.]
MSNKLLSYIEDKLKERRRHLLKEVNLRLTKFNRSRECWVTDTAEIASNIMEDNTVMSIAQGEAREINHIDNTLKKMKNGKYGVCDCCGGNINEQRLIAIPFASLCIKCKEAEESEEQNYDNTIKLHEYEGFETTEEETRNVMDDGGIDINQLDN